MSKPGRKIAPERCLEQVLAQWRQWRCNPPLPGAPHLLHKLDGGLSNHNYLVSASSQQWVVRIDGVNPLHHGLNRQLEFRTLQEAAQAGVAPTPCYFNPELGALVYRYLAADDEQSMSVEELAGLCRAIHTLPPRHQRLDLEARARRYLGLIERAGKQLPDAGITETLIGLFRRYHNAPLVLCHNDLLPANLLRSGDRLRALDWEYAAMGNPWFDLAVAGDGQNYDNRDYANFLGAYLGHPPGAQDWLQLGHHRAIYRYIELLWHLVESSPEHNSEILDSATPQLHELLNGLDTG